MGVKYKTSSFGIVKDVVPYGTKITFRVIVAGSTPPRNLVSKILFAKDRVHEQLYVVAGGEVAVEVDAAGVLEDAVEFNHTLGHHGEVGHHVVVAEEGAHGLEQVGELAGSVGYDVLIGTLGIKAPMPGVFEGGDLGGGLLAAFFLEEDVVVGVGVEGRVEVDEVNAGVGDVVAEDVEVVAEVELVL